ncbi:MAG: AmmeMemoRadiSam system protein A [Anaerolineae bacterium]|nr:AmmeMemoRadiSam system protein A [Anaerolineae bacterium]
MNTEYTHEEQKQLLRIARQALEAVTHGQPRPELGNIPAALKEPRACFVTLRRNETQELRGCTGTVTARRPLAEEVSISTEQTALHDPRFSPVSANETPDINIEISVLTPPVPLDYESPADLLKRVRPNIDGVFLQHGYHRATYLPQVWESIADPAQFFTMLSRKMGLPGDAWRTLPMKVFTYQSISFEEED